MRKLLTALMVAIAPGFTFAADLAFVVGTGGYTNLPAVSDGDSMLQVAQGLRARNYTVIEGSGPSEAEMKELFADFTGQVDEADRIVVVLSGRFLTLGSETYYAPRDLSGPEPRAVAFDAMPLSAMLAWLGQRPGEAVLFLATDDTPRDSGFNGVGLGIGPLDIPQGVMVAEGSPRDVRFGFAQFFLNPRLSIAEAAAAYPVLDYSGFLSRRLSLGAVANSQGNDDAVAIERDQPTPEEQAFWRVVDELASKDGYEAFLRRYPDGQFSGLARQRLAAIDNQTPKVSPDEQAERDMALTREDRRDVQRWLDLLGFDPRGVDGIFGPATRGALTRWQGRNGLEPTGFLSPESLARLRKQADKRAAELRREAERKKAEQDRRDAAFWRDTGATGSEAGLRAYLERYPDGIYSDAAREQLAAIEADNRRKAQRDERRAWDAARETGTVRAYRNFLSRYPEGVFAPEAKSRLAQLLENDATRKIREAARAEEEHLQIPRPTRVLAENKLMVMGFDPGQVDGVFDKQTRKAIRRYQRSRDLPVSGFLTRQTAVRLLSE